MSGTLFEVDGYPGGCYLPDADTHVVGELYQLDDTARLFAALDAYEESSAHFAEPREYQRQRIPVTLNDGGMVRAWVYLYSCTTEGLESIESGDYLYWQGEVEGLLSHIKLDQTGRFSNSLPGKVLFWIVLLLVIVLAGMWFFGHTGFLIDLEQMGWLG